jgi:hypothetical protein
MPQGYNLTCATCGQPMWQGPGSRPQGEATCQPCRRLTPRRSSHRTSTQRWVECAVCRALFETDRPNRKYCSPICRERRGNKVKRTSTQPERERANARYARRGSTTQRGLGAEHRARRRALLPAAIGTRCPIGLPGCDGIMTDPTRMDLDHTTPRALGGTHGDRIACSRCNRSSGATLGNRLRGRSGPRRTRRRAQDDHPRPPLPRW